MKILYYIIASIILIIGSYNSVSYASPATTTNINIQSPVINGQINSIALPEIHKKTSGSIIGGIISWFIAITAVLAIMSITWAAIQMVLAVGEDEKIKKARYTMIYSFIGLIVAGLAYGTVSFVVKLDLNSFL